MDIIIDGTIDLRLALKNLRYFGTARAFLLRIANLSPEENVSIQDRLNRLASACGCGTAAVGSVLVTTSYLAHVFGTGLESGGGLITVVITSVMLFLISGAIGKIVGVIYSHWRLQRTLAELLERIDIQDAAGNR